MSREKAEYVVLKLGSGETRETRIIVITARGLSNKADCEAWIRKNGEDGKLYQKASLLGPPCRVAIEHKEIRRIRPVEMGDEAE